MAPPSTTGTASPSDSAADAARDLKDRAGEAAEERAQQGKRVATDALDDVAGALHAASDDLRDHDRDQFARYADVAADQVEQFVGSVRDKSVGELLDEAERFARRDRDLFIGGAFLLGVFGARFLKASSPDRFDRRAGGSGFGHRTADPYRYRAGYGARGHRTSGSGRADRVDYNEPPYRVQGTAGARMPDPTGAAAGGGRIIAPSGVTGAAAPSGVTGAAGRTGVGGALAGAAGTGGTIGAGAGASRSAADNPSGL